MTRTSSYDNLARAAKFVEQGQHRTVVGGLWDEVGRAHSVDHSPGGDTAYPDRDLYHYHRGDLVIRCHGLHWQLEWLEQWGHPRDQWMAVLARTERPDQPSASE